jgi:peptidoglycan/LPS O-acetylase OafA/YrhL
LLTSKIPYFLFGTIAGKLFTMFEKRPDGITTGIACLILLVLFFLSRGLYPTQTPFWGLTSAFIGAVIVYLAACENRFSSAVLGSKPLVFAGKISFSLYLFHVPVIFLMMKLVGPLVPTPLAIAISVGMAYLFASMTNLVIEETSRRFLVGLWRRRRSAEPAIYPAPEAAR